MTVYIEDAVHEQRASPGENGAFEWPQAHLLSRRTVLSGQEPVLELHQSLLSMEWSLQAMHCIAMLIEASGPEARGAMHLALWTEKAPVW